MQTTLLGLAIAIIIALVAALVGPSFIDWNQYKPQFEAEATRVVGAPVRVEGALDARLLPAPILRLRSLSVGTPNDPTRMRAAKLDVEFSLGSLMRGEWRANQLSLDGVALDIGLDATGHVVAPSKGAFNFGALAIDRLDLTGKISVHDAAAGADYVLNDIVFSGDVRALGSNMRGDGSFALKGARQSFRLAMSQTADNSGTRLRLDLDPAKEGDAAGSLDGILTSDQRSPRFDGIATMMRQGEQPWRVSAKTKASPAGASFDQAELLYGADDTGVKFAGNGELSFGKSPRLQASIAAQQLDLDRAMTGAAASQNLIALAKSALQSSITWPTASQIDLNVDRVVLAGRPVNNLAAKLRGAADSWTLEKFSCEAPGSTMISVNGTAEPENEKWTGPIRVETKAANVFFDWIYRRPNIAYRSDAPLKLSATARLGKDSIALENLKADLDGSVVEGRLSSIGRMLKLALTSPSFDFADAQSVINFAATGLPAEAQIALDFAQARIGDRIVRPLNVDLSYKSADPPNQLPSLSKASVDLAVKHFDVTPWLGAPQNVSDLAGKFIIADNKFSLNNFDGKLGDTRVRGSLSLVRGDALDIGGDLSADAIALGPLVGLALGASGQEAAQPLEQGWFGVRGSLAVKANTAALPGGAELKTVSATLSSDGTSLAIDHLKASLDKGDVVASVQAKRDLSGTSVSANIKVNDADAASMIYRNLSVPSEHASLQMSLASEGRSAMALSNAISGNGILTLDDVQLPELNPAAFDAVIQAADKNSNADVKQVAMDALDQAAFTQPSLQIPFAIKDARLRVDPVSAEAGNARLTFSGGYDLPADQIDIRASLRSTNLGTPAPEIQIFAHGTPDDLQHETDVSSLLSWLSLRQIERETKRLDDLEKSSAPTPGLPAAPITPQSPPIAVAVPPQAPALPPSSPSGMHAPEPQKTRPAPKPVARSPVPSPAPNITASDQQLAPLPPPIDIRPAPGTARPRRQLAPLPPPGTTF